MCRAGCSACRRTTARRRRQPAATAGSLAEEGSGGTETAPVRLRRAWPRRSSPRKSETSWPCGWRRPRSAARPAWRDEVVSSRAAILLRVNFMTSSPAMLAGDEITITPTELVAGGAAIARVDGFPIFATNVYPGDVAVVRLLEVKKGIAHADLVRVVVPSPSRRVMPCPVARECGGCDWAALRLDRQLEAKQRILTESLRRIGKIDPATLPPIAIHPSPLNYRLRSRLHRDGGKVGFYAMRTNDVVQLPPECEVVGPRTREEPRDGETWEVDGTLVTEGEMTIDGYHVTTGAFFQVNRHLLATMRELVMTLANRVAGVGGRGSENAGAVIGSDPRPPTADSRKTAIDLYSGV